MSATLDQVLQQEQLHYQVINQKIDNLYTNLNSSINTQDQRVITYLTSEEVNTRAKIDGNDNIIISKINSTVGAIPNDIVNSTNAINKKIDSLQTNVYGKIDVVSNNVLADIDKRSATTDGNIDYAMNRILSQVDGDTKLVEGKVDGALTANLDKANTLYQLIIDRTGSVNTTLNNSVQTKIDESESLLNKQTTVILNAINTAANATQNPIVNVATPATPPVQNGTDFLSQLIAVLSGASPAGAQDNSDSPTPYGGRPILLSTGNSTLDPNIFSYFFGNFGTSLTNQIQQISTIVNNASQGHYATLDAFETDFKKLGVDSDFVTSILQLLFIIPSLLNIGKQLSDVFNIRIQRLAAQQYDLAQLDVSSLVEMFRRKEIDQPTALLEIEQLGYSNKDAQNLLNLGIQLLDTNTLIKLHQRELLDENTIAQKASQIGFTYDDFKLLERANALRPGIADYINFASKQLYSPDIVAKFGNTLELPQGLINDLQSNGLDSEFTEQLWKAHWQVPGTSVGFDMLHRGIISSGDMVDLLKVLDITPFWRDKLQQESYKVLSRIDARRLHAFNIIDDTELRKIYKENSFTDQDADRLVKLANTIEDEQENPKKKKLRELTYSVIITAYGDGLLSKQDVKTQLLPLGYDDGEIELLLRIEDYTLANKKIKVQKEKHYAKLTDIATKSYINRSISRDELLSYLRQAGFSDIDAQSEANFIDAEYAISFKAQIAKSVEQQYFEGLYSDTDVIVSLQSLGFLPTEAQNILTQLQTLKTFRTKKPSLGELTSLYKKGFYTLDEYTQILRNDGYAEQYIPGLLYLANPDNAGG